MNKIVWDGNEFPIIIKGEYNPILYNQLFCANVRYKISAGLGGFSVSGTGTIVCGAGGNTRELCIVTNDRDVGKHCDIRVSSYEIRDIINMDIYVIGKKCPNWSVDRSPFDEKTIEALKANVKKDDVEKFEIPMESDKPDYLSAPTKFGEYQTYKFKVLCSGENYGDYKEVFERELNSERVQSLLNTNRGIPIVDLTTHERRTKHLLSIFDTVWPSDSIGYVNTIRSYDGEFYVDARPLYHRGITDKFFQDMEDNNVRVTPVFLGVKDKPKEWTLMYFTLLL